MMNNNNVKITIQFTLLLFSIMWCAYSVYAVPKVTQAAFVDFKNNDVMALAVEEFGQPPVVHFVSLVREILYTVTFDSAIVSFDEFAFVNCFVKFKVAHIPDFPSPLVIALAVQPTGTDKWVDVKLIAEKDGHLVELNPEPISVTIQDGFYLGPINTQYGNGLVIWNFEWDAAHYAPHTYTITIYQWDREKTSFVLKKKFTTPERYETGCDALQAYDLPCKNIRDDILTIDGDKSSLGAETLLPDSEMNGE